MHGFGGRGGEGIAAFSELTINISHNLTYKSEQRKSRRQFEIPISLHFSHFLFLSLVTPKNLLKEHVCSDWSVGALEGLKKILCIYCSLFFFSADSCIFDFARSGFR